MFIPEYPRSSRFPDLLCGINTSISNLSTTSSSISSIHHDCATVKDSSVAGFKTFLFFLQWFPGWRSALLNHHGLEDLLFPGRSSRPLRFKNWTWWHNESLRCRTGINFFHHGVIVTLAAMRYPWRHERRDIGFFFDLLLSISKSPTSTNLIDKSLRRVRLKRTASVGDALDSSGIENWFLAVAPVVPGRPVPSTLILRCGCRRMASSSIHLNRLAQPARLLV